nr:SAM-dependent methyltransferase [Flexivirga meconopsidis]
MYGDAGLYRQPAGPAGHFATSAQGIPGGGALLAAAVDSLADAHGCRAVVDFAAGRGELLTELAHRGTARTLIGVDVVDRPADLPASIDWLRSPGGATLPSALAGLSKTLVIAHEWLDVVPCEIAEFDGVRWRRVEVDDNGTERLGNALDPANTEWLQRHWPAPSAAGERAEVGRTRDLAVADLRSRMASGLLILVDYGHLHDDRPRHGSLTGFRDGRQQAPRPDGSTDVTAHVAMDSLGADRLVCQRDLFAELDLEPPRPAITLASSDPPAYLRQLAQRSAYGQLTARGGLGDFWWALTTIS